MASTSEKLKCRLENDIIHIDSSHNEKLKISFQRTIRVPDNESCSNLPPTIGTFPLYSVRNYAKNLPPEMAAKGGLFMPMYQREAMWIDLDSPDEFAVKIYVGGINAVSGEPAEETAATRLRRQNLFSQGRSMQDYVATPAQLWLDGIATSEGKVRQFVAMPMGNGYTVEAQMTGEEVTGGLQFEITPLDRSPKMEVYVRGMDGDTVPVGLRLNMTVEEAKQVVASGRMLARQIELKFNERTMKDDLTLADYDIQPGDTLHLRLILLGGIQLFVRTFAGKPITFATERDERIENVKSVIEEIDGIPVVQQTIIFAGKQLEDGINTPSCHPALWRRRGGGQEQPEMGIAPGGLIQQYIAKDKRLTSDWDPSRTLVFNVQILNTARFYQVTGTQAPEPPIDASTYAAAGFPFFSVYEEPTDVAGSFGNIKSVGQIDGEVDPETPFLVKHIDSKPPRRGSNEGPVTENPNGTMRPFRTARQLDRELQCRTLVVF